MGDSKYCDCVVPVLQDPVSGLCQRCGKTIKPWRRLNIKIRDCFWWKKGKCRSQEISRFRHDEGNDTCLYDADAAVFVDEYVKRGMDPLRCHEFRFKGEKEK